MGKKRINGRKRGRKEGRRDPGYFKIPEPSSNTFEIARFGFR